ncbi:cobalamin B12-binding domain-containing protein [Ramlibacter sp. PS4R-6]|uniref:cobalamin B12-binding domain-containing protein n=1 Tax=Ramlibacter sp. PS4R-6 TaxID=3133438 RepID=UPI0030A355DA
MSAPEGALAARAIRDHAAPLAEALVQREFAARPDLAARFGPHGRAKSLEDASYHFAFLAQALELARPALFDGYIGWVKALLAHRRVTPEDLKHHLERMVEALIASLPAGAAALAVDCVGEAIARLPRHPASVDAALGRIPQRARDYLALMLALDAEGARRLVVDELRRGVGIGELYLQVLAPAMHEVGLLWQAARISVAQEHYCTGVTLTVAGELSASVHAVRAGRTAIVACVSGEQHSLGSRMVADFLDLTGWRTLWLGASTPTRDLLHMAEELDADLLAISCSYAPYLHDVAKLIAALRAQPATRDVKVMVGGHAFAWCEGLWRDVGADGYAEDAAQAAQCAHQLLARA